MDCLICDCQWVASERCVGPARALAYALPRLSIDWASLQLLRCGVRTFCLQPVSGHCVAPLSPLDAPLPTSDRRRYLHELRAFLRDAVAMGMALALVIMLAWKVAIVETWCGVGCAAP